MTTDADVAVTGGLFVVAAAMLWLGWVLLPVRIGVFFQPTDFGAVHARLRLWIWLFRLHLFGHIVAVMAFVALAVSLSGLSGAPLVAPAVAVLCVGLVVTTLAAAFYYHFAAWGALDMHGKEDEAVRSLVSSLRVPTEYVTCLTRFGRVFFGFGQVVLAVGVLGSTLLPLWLVAAGATLEGSD